MILNAKDGTNIDYKVPVSRRPYSSYVGNFGKRIAEWQWDTGRSFREIADYVPIKEKLFPLLITYSNDCTLEKRYAAIDKIIEEGKRKAEENDSQTMEMSP